MKHVAIIGGGPAGLMAAEAIASAGRDIVVTVYDRMPSLGRKLLMAGRGGLNLTHREAYAPFLARYGAAAAWMRPHIEAFPPDAAIKWCEGLGQETFVGSSGRIFPKAMKASPLLRAWLRRLDAFGVRVVTRATWTGWDDVVAPASGRVAENGLAPLGGALTFQGMDPVKADAVVLALGGASWPRLGSDGGWTTLLPDVAIAPLRPANCGFAVPWSDVFRQRHAGQPLKRIALAFDGQVVRGEAVITEKGIEGGAVYALASDLREAIAKKGEAILRIDLRPDLDAATVARNLAQPRGGASLSTHLRKRVGLDPVAVGLVQEALHTGSSEVALPALVKSLPIRLTAPFAIARAISTAGGIATDELDAHLMLRKRPGVFAAGEMLDWEAPTGGYLLQACLATGVAAGRGALAWLARNPLPTGEGASAASG